MRGLRPSPFACRLKSLVMSGVLVLLRGALHPCQATESDSITYLFGHARVVDLSAACTLPTKPSVSGVEVPHQCECTVSQFLVSDISSCPSLGSVSMYVFRCAQLSVVRRQISKVRKGICIPSTLKGKSG